MSKKDTPHDEIPGASVFEVRFDKGILNAEQTAAIEKAIQEAVMEQVARLKVPAKPRLQAERLSYPTRGMEMG